VIVLDAAAVLECDCCAQDMPLELDSYIVLNDAFQVWTFVCAACIKAGPIWPLAGLRGDVWIKPSGREYWAHHFVETPKKKIYRARKTPAQRKYESRIRGKVRSS
jgi:hypothetical protein